MAKKKGVNIKKNVKDLGSVFSELGEAVTSVFKDSKLKKETKKLGRNIADTARTFANRFQNKEVKKQFRDVSRAATKFGKNVAKSVKAVSKSNKKCTCKKCGKVNCKCGCKVKKSAKKKMAKKK